MHVRGVLCVSVKLLLRMALILHLKMSGSWWEGKVGRGKGVKILLSEETTRSRRAAQHLSDFPTTSREKVWKT